ncbi:hypothetical protein UACE39S_01455 [Ureibacillus acetophenoni]
MAFLKGYPDGTFKAGEPITRAHAALIIAKVLGLDTKNVTDPGFKDVPKTHDYYGAIAALENKGYIKGFPDGTYGMNKTLTRGQMAVILKNAFELEGQAEKLPFTDTKGHDYESHVSTLFANGVTKGVSATKFGLADNVTRGQLATFVVKAEIASPEKVVDIKDGQLITTKGKYAIDAELAKVFNAANLAALKGAKIKLEEETTAFASLQTFVAAETAKLKLKSLTITSSSATFDAGGYYIPNVTVNGTKVVVKNVVTEKITVAEGLTVELVGVEAKEVAIQGDTKLKLDATTKIEKIQVPVGKTLADVISNYEEVKDIVKDIVVVDEKGKEVKPEPPTPGTGGGGGGGGSTESATEKALDKAITALVANYNEDFTTYGSAFFDSDANRITVTFDSAKNETTISTFRGFLKDQAAGLSLVSLITEGGLTFAEAGEILDNVPSVKITAGDYTFTYDVEDYITDSFDVDRTLVVDHADDFIDAAITANGGNVVNISQFKTKFADNIKIEAGGITYTVEIK